MKKTLLSILFLASLYSQAEAQSFELVSGSAVNWSIGNGINYVPNHIKNTAATGSGDSIMVNWKVTGHDMPTNWADLSASFGICDNIICYPNTGNALLSGSTSHITAKIAPQEEADFHIQINLDNVGSGSHFIDVNFTEGTTSKDTKFTITKGPTGVTTITRYEDDIVMYPNPAKDFVNVLFNANDNVKTIAIHNMIGKLVNIYKVSTNSARLETGDLPAGVYFVRLQDAQGRIVGTRKFTHQ